ncbi:MAG: beta-CASP ribonuclease aCPSF1 [Candidatus Nanoarchaeia archaeon]|nr:beta-CASP ribonuclease aCPSF1 [Candidatus Nanoarchaeia archaeon]
MSTDILKDVQKELPKVISSANFEGANIVLYTDDMDFFRDNNGIIKELVNKFKKRIELRADEKLLLSQEETEKEIKKTIPEDAGLTDILFDPQRSIVVIEAKRPGLVIGKSGLLLKEVKDKTFWIPQVQRSPAIKSKITENIRDVLYQNNNTRKKFLNSVGKKIYKEWNPEKIEGWIRLTILGGGRQVGRSCILLSTPQSKILLDCGVDVAGRGQDKFPYLNVSEFKINELDAIVLTHAHLDHSGLIPYLFKMGYRGPVYMTAPTRDIAALLALDFIGVAYKQASAPLFSSTDIKEMVKHTICLNFNEVTDIAPDIRITLYNSGHALGSALVHINVGNGAHNLLYSGDMKFIKTKLLDRAIANFPRLETMIIESTYGSKNDVLPSRQESEDELIKTIKETIEKKGKILIPELGLGRAQETMLVLEEAMRENKLPKIPIYIDGMIWDINGIHTAYPDFLNSNVRSDIFQDNNPFVSDIFKRVGSQSERKEVIEGGPCVVLATSGMLVGGASVEYFKHFASNKNNKICFVCYQGVGSLGRQVQDGFKQIKMNIDGKEEIVEINMSVITIAGLTAHAGRNELLDFVNRCQPRPNRIIINHGEQSKCLDLASSVYKLHHIETNVPRNLETIRLR